MANFQSIKRPVCARDFSRISSFLFTSLLFALSGCSTHRYASAAGQFGQLTSVVTVEQNKRIEGVAADQAELFHADLAARKTPLTMKDCADLLVDQPPEKTASPKAASGCRIVERQADGQFVDLAPAFRLDQIIALNSALNDYGQSLVTLAGDASADKARFTSAVSGLATSLGGLEGAIRKATGQASADPATAAKFGTIASLVAKIGSLYLDDQRATVLKRIIIEADPLVQKAVKILGDADADLNLYDRAGLYKQLVLAQAAANQALLAGNVSGLRTAQDNLFAATHAYNGYRIDRYRFEAIGHAHSSLVHIAQSKASDEELKQLLEELLTLSSTVHETMVAFEEEKQ